MVSLLSTRTLRSSSAELHTRPVSPQLLLLCGIIPSQVQDLMFIVVKSHALLVSLVFQHVEASLYGGSSFWLSSSLMFSMNLVKIHSISSSRSSVKILNVIGLPV